MRRDVRRDAEYPAAFLTNGDVIVTLWRATDPTKASPFDRKKNVGLHHLAFQVDNIYETCQKLMDGGVTINRPPRDGYMAFVRSPDNISVELLQNGDALPAQEPWASMENTGAW